MLLQLGTDMPGFLVTALSGDPEYEGNEEANDHLAEVLAELARPSARDRPAPRPIQTVLPNKRV